MKTGPSDVSKKKEEKDHIVYCIGIVNWRNA